MLAETVIGEGSSLSFGLIVLSMGVIGGAIFFAGSMSAKLNQVISMLSPLMTKVENLDKRVVKIEGRLEERREHHDCGRGSNNVSEI